ncbi:MAG TPA: hypothetical protein VH540_20520 [Ktedonobacterales bacterium]|jgi:hypothetical protein
MSKSIRRTLTQRLTRLFSRSARSDSSQDTSDFARKRTANELEKQLGSVDGARLDQYTAGRWKMHRLWG